MIQEFEKSADTLHMEIDGVVQELTKIVEQEVHAFQKLLKALLEQQHSIIHGDTASISSSNVAVEQMMSETRTLEKKRHAITKGLTSALNHDQQLTLAELIPMVQEQYGERLKMLRQMLLDLSHKIQSTNQRNHFLLEHSLAFVDRSMRILMGAATENVTYNQGGQMDSYKKALYRGVG